MHAPTLGMTADNSVRDPKQLVRLRQSHRLTFERYLDIATRTCGRLATLTPETLSDIDRANLIAGTRKEAAAHEAYLKAKTTLTRYLLGEVTNHASSGANHYVAPLHANPWQGMGE